MPKYIKYRSALYIRHKTTRRRVAVYGPSPRVEEALRMMSRITPQLVPQLDDLSDNLGIPPWRIVLDAQDRGLSIGNEIRELTEDAASRAELKELVDLETEEGG